MEKKKKKERITCKQGGNVLSSLLARNKMKSNGSKRKHALYQRASFLLVASLVTQILLSRALTPKTGFLL